MAKKTKSEKVPKHLQDRFITITKLTDKFCKEYLNDEYAQLSRYATAALCRKRPSPLASGKINSWASSIIHATGFVNFLFDKNNDPYITFNELCNSFGIGKSTVSTKSKIIRDALKMTRFDHNWTLPSRMENSSMAWTIMFNDFMVDARSLPLEIQEIAYEKGLIPYIPSQK